jgi:hypothetical protein
MTFCFLLSTSSLRAPSSVSNQRRYFVPGWVSRHPQSCRAVAGWRWRWPFTKLLEEAPLIVVVSCCIGIDETTSIVGSHNTRQEKRNHHDFLSSNGVRIVKSQHFYIFWGFDSELNSIRASTEHWTLHWTCLESKVLFVLVFASSLTISSSNYIHKTETNRGKRDCLPITNGSQWMNASLWNQKSSASVSVDRNCSAPF